MNLSYKVSRIRHVSLLENVNQSIRDFKAQDNRDVHYQQTSYKQDIGNNITCGAPAWFTSLGVYSLMGDRYLALSW
jgi:hypothetical protein